jgi:hypothetical protein
MHISLAIHDPQDAVAVHGACFQSGDQEQDLTKRMKFLDLDGCL